MAKKGANKLRAEFVRDTGEGLAAQKARPAENRGSLPRSGSLPEWQEKLADGSIRCLACNKIVDEQHLKTDAHLTKLERWKLDQEHRAENYKAPELPYLAWVPCEGERRYLMCLLCRKSGKTTGTWVSEEATHSGTHEMPAGSKEHRKNLQNYPPDHPWYIENVTRARLQYHPDSQPEGFLRTGERKSKELSSGYTAAQYPARTDDANCRRQDVGVPPGLSASDWLGRSDPDPPEPPDDSAELPPGWACAQDTDGNTYYYHIKERISQWELPSWSAA